MENSDSNNIFGTIRKWKTHGSRQKDNFVEGQDIVICSQKETTLFLPCIFWLKTHWKFSMYLNPVMGSRIYALPFRKA